MQIHRLLKNLCYVAWRVIRRLIFGRDPGLRILTYHYVSEQTANQFERQIVFLKSQFRVVSLLQGLNQLHTQQMPTIAITFDDCYESVWKYAVPLLQRHNIPATFYPCSDFITEDRLPTSSFQRFYPTISGKPGKLDTLMTWGELRQLKNNGFDIGCHTATHPRLSLVADEHLDYELLNAKRAIEEKVGVPVSTLAFPYGNTGSWDDRVVATARDAGFRACLTSIRGINTKRSDHFLLKRFAVRETWSITKLGLVLL